MTQVFVYVCALLFCFVSSGIADLEPACPRCSKFDYEEKLLERFIRMEFTVDKILNENKAVSGQMKEDMDNILNENKAVSVHMKQDMNTILNENKAVSDHMKQDMDKIRNENKAVSDQMKRESEEFLASARSSLDEVMQLAKDNGTPFVFFHASSPTDTTPSTGETIKFSDIQTNEGLGYDDNTGNFTTPVSGLYMFFVQICVNYNSYAQLQIVKEGSVLIASTYYDSAGTQPCSSTQVVTRLEVGESVWVKCVLSSQLVHGSRRWTSFGGALVHI